jgi:phage-related protein
MGTVERPIDFLGSSLKDIRQFPPDVMTDCGFQLYRLQMGEAASDVKPMASIGKGVEEIRLKDRAGIYRVIYVARFEEAVYVLHAFQKKTEATSVKDIELARERFREMTAKHVAHQMIRIRK